MNIPLIIQKTKGEKETELADLEHAIQQAKDDYNIKGVVTGTVESAYQASRIQKICDTLDLDCFNPLWQKDQFELLDDLMQHNFDIIITGVFAYPLTESWLGRAMDITFIRDVKKLYEHYHINPAGEGGEFESYVQNCPLFSKRLTVREKHRFGKQNSWTMEIEVL